MKTLVTRFRIVPVIVLDDLADALPMADALIEAGLPVLEITLRTPAALEAIALLRRERPELLVGAGTVLTPAQVSEACAAGAQFGLSPGLNPRVVLAAREAGMFFMPGVMTPTDVELALELGCDTLKFFPAEPAGGIALLRAIAAPFAHTGVGFVPLGSVNTANMQAYLQLPCVPAIGGSWICERTLLRAKRWEEIRRLAAEAVSLAKARR
jgi:2-dehydro-3-deoxyphosphogluconate aldolase/(4S)-4-hydroxy-2-oxoglutarate aldolase